MTSLDLHLAAARISPASTFRTWLAALDQGLTRLCDRLLDARDRAAQRRQALGLSDAALKDFAASRADAERAAQ